MVQVTFFSTSKPIVDKKNDGLHDTISNKIEDEIRCIDSDATVNCAAHIIDGMAYINGEIQADSSLDVSSIARKKINQLFDKDSS